MSNDEKQSTTEPESDPEPVTTPEIQPAARVGSLAAGSRRGVVGWVVLTALIVLAGGGAYSWQEGVYHKDLAGLRGRLAALDRAQSTLRAEIDAAAVDAATAAATSDTLRSEIDTTIAAQGDLRRSVSALYERELQTSVDWILAEAEYLVLAATQRLALERDVDTAIAALRAADQRLRSAAHPDLIPIREQVIADVTALEAVSLPDIEGLAIYIAKTIDRVDTLPTKAIAEEAIPVTGVRSGEYKAEDWRRLAYAVWSDLVDLVEVKDADLPDSVVFDPKLRYFLRQNLKLELASARLAVLRRDRANLAASVGLVKRVLEAYYDVNDAGVATIIKRLDEAAALELNPALPNITGSLDLIRKHRGSHPADMGSPR